MSFARIRSPGGWLDNSVVTQAEWEAFDDHQSKAIDGFGGGSYSPTSQIVIAGTEGLLINAPITIAGDFECTDADPEFTQGLAVNGVGLLANHVAASLSLASSGTLTVTGASTFNGAATFNGDFECTDNDPEFTQGLAVNGVGLLANHVAASLSLSSAGTLTVTGATTLNGAVSISDKITLTGDGRIKYRITTGTDANGTYSISSTDIVRVPAGTLTAHRTYSIDATGAEDGMLMHISRIDDNSAFNLIVQFPDLSSVTLGANDALTIVYHSSGWRSLLRGDI